ncbi:hypothetical protein Tco_1067893 [Tanacetum coccineum]|uniref:Uncharacterized protein n=2 Tax=Tanacetum coccineum TaxID=301880 RepID=A0ABQ5HE84_9ASTR
MPRTSSDQLADNLHDVMMETLPSVSEEKRKRLNRVHILHVHPAQVQSSSVSEQQHQLYLAMKADPLLQQQDIAIWLALQMKFEKIQINEEILAKVTVVWEKQKELLSLRIPTKDHYHYSKLHRDPEAPELSSELTNDEVEFLKLFEEEIEVSIELRDQMRDGNVR